MCARIVTLLATATRVGAQSRGALLGELTWPEAEARLRAAPIVILPFGAGAKEHGPHLPLNADQRVMEYLVRQAVDSLDVVVAPPILHGWFPAFREFPGTEVADPDVFRRYVHEVAASLVRHGARRIVLLNTGIRNATGLPLAIAAMLASHASRRTFQLKRAHATRSVAHGRTARMAVQHACRPRAGRARENASMGG